MESGFRPSLVLLCPQTKSRGGQELRRRQQAPGQIYICARGHAAEAMILHDAESFGIPGIKSYGVACLVRRELI